MECQVAPRNHHGNGHKRRERACTIGFLYRRTWPVKREHSGRERAQLAAMPQGNGQNGHYEEETFRESTDSFDAQDGVFYVEKEYINIAAAVIRSRMRRERAEYHKY